MHRTTTFETIRVKGDILTLHNCRKIVHSVRHALSEGHTHLELDFSEVDEATGSFAGFLAQIIRNVRDVKGKLQIVRANQEVECLLRLLGFSEYLRRAERPGDA